MNSKPKSIVFLGENIAINWDDGSESFISNRMLREHCPCSSCNGEVDVFGNIYVGKKKPSNNQKNIIDNYIKVGHYAIRIIWGDGHDAGIYTFELLKSLNDKQ